MSSTDDKEVTEVPRKILKLSAPEFPSSSTRVLLFIRHGDYHESAEGETSKRLTDLGHKQANKASTAISNFPELPKITKLVSSILIRAIETAEIIREDLPGAQYREDSNLIEGSIDNDRDVDRFERVYTTYCMPVQGRHSEAEIIVTHGNLIRYLVFRILGLHTSIRKVLTSSTYPTVQLFQSASDQMGE